MKIQFNYEWNSFKNYSVININPRIFLIQICPKELRTFLIPELATPANSHCHIHMQISGEMPYTVWGTRTWYSLSPTSSVGVIVLKKLLSLIYCERHLILRLPLISSIFAQFPERFLKGLVSGRSFGEYKVIDCRGEMLSWIFSCPFCSTILQCGARLPIQTVCFWTVYTYSSASFQLLQALRSTLLYIVDTFHYCLRWASFFRQQTRKLQSPQIKKSNKNMTTHRI